MTMELNGRLTQQFLLTNPYTMGTFHDKSDSVKYIGLYQGREPEKIIDRSEHDSVKNSLNGVQLQSCSFEY